MRKLIIVLFLFTSCGPAYKLRRAEKLIAKAELQGAKWKVDTVFQTIHDTIPAFKVDTVLNTRVQIDTIRMLGGGEIVIKRDTIRRTERIQVLGPSIVRTIRVPYTVTKTISAPKENKVAPWWRTAAIIDGVLLLLLLVVIVGRSL